MGTDNSKRNGTQRITFQHESAPLFSLTKTSALTSAFSAAAAYYHAPQQLDTAETLALAVIVAAGTFLAAKIGKKVGGAVGLVGGAIAGGTVGTGLGTLLGALAGRKDARIETATAGGTIGGTTGFVGGAAALAIIGALSGFFGGAYAGHVYTRDIAMKHIFNKSDFQRNTVETPASISVISYDRVTNKVYIPA